MVRSDAIIVGIAVVGVAVPVGAWLASLHAGRAERAQRAERAERPERPERAERAERAWPEPSRHAARAERWRLSHKTGYVFALTNMAGDTASDVEVKPANACVEVKLRGAPWQAVADGGTVEFVAMSQPAAAASVVISWRTPDGTSHTGEMIIGASDALAVEGGLLR